ncbi:di-trans,poly-cis-decaprenylcistransferase [Patescibacteria group bacterium]|nr:MAG: di-trans,poly-cis-decaprenylcistransferase [Patescibacteria group bacterium]
MSKAQSVGIIMDGNRRYAQKNGITTLEGHKAGYAKLKELLSWAEEAGVRYVTVYAFSTENWKRDPGEVAYLMDLFRFALQNEIQTFIDRKTRVQVIGDRSRLSTDLQKMIENAEKKTAHFSEMTLAIAFSYGGRAEIVDACSRVAEKYKNGEIEKIDETVLSEHMWTAQIPDPDLIIRTSGEVRLSNFLPWQSVYGELAFTKTLWPDLTKEEFIDILNDFEKRSRRKGK